MEIARWLERGAKDCGQAAGDIEQSLFKASDDAVVVLVPRQMIAKTKMTISAKCT